MRPVEVSYSFSPSKMTWTPSGLLGPAVMTRSATSQPCPSVYDSPGVTTSGRTRYRSQGWNCGLLPDEPASTSDVKPSVCPISCAVTASKSVRLDWMPSLGLKS